MADTSVWLRKKMKRDGKFKWQYLRINPILVAGGGPVEGGGGGGGPHYGTAGIGHLLGVQWEPPPAGTVMITVPGGISLEEARNALMKLTIMKPLGGGTGEYYAELPRVALPPGNPPLSFYDALPAGRRFFKPVRKGTELYAIMGAPASPVEGGGGGGGGGGGAPIAAAAPENNGWGDEESVEWGDEAAPLAAYAELLKLPMTAAERQWLLDLLQRHATAAGGGPAVLAVDPGELSSYKFSQEKHLRAREFAEAKIAQVRGVLIAPSVPLGFVELACKFAWARSFILFLKGVNSEQIDAQLRVEINDFLSIIKIINDGTTRVGREVAAQLQAQQNSVFNARLNEAAKRGDHDEVVALGTIAYQLTGNTRDKAPGRGGNFRRDPAALAHLQEALSATASGGVTSLVAQLQAAGQPLTAGTAAAVFAITSINFDKRQVRRASFTNLGEETRQMLVPDSNEGVNIIDITKNTIEFMEVLLGTAMPCTSLDSRNRSRGEAAGGGGGGGGGGGNAGISQEALNALQQSLAEAQTYVNNPAGVLALSQRDGNEWMTRPFLAHDVHDVHGGAPRYFLVHESRGPELFGWEQLPPPFNEERSMKETLERQSVIQNQQLNGNSVLYTEQLSKLHAPIGKILEEIAAGCFTPSIFETVPELMHQFPPDIPGKPLTYIKDSNGTQCVRWNAPYRLVSVQCGSQALMIEKDGNISRASRHSFAFICVNGIWYRAENATGFLERMPGPPGWDFPVPGSIIYAKIKLFVRADIALSGFPPGDLTGMLAPYKFMTACTIDSMHSILSHSDGASYAFTKMLTEILDENPNLANLFVLQLFGKNPTTRPIREGLKIAPERHVCLIDKDQDARIMFNEIMRLVRNKLRALIPGDRAQPLLNKLSHFLANMFIRFMTHILHARVTGVVGQSGYHPLRRRFEGGYRKRHLRHKTRRGRKGKRGHKTRGHHHKKAK